MTFSRPDSADVRVTDFEARPSINGWRYVSEKITADVSFAECNDGMSELTYKDQVGVKVGGVEYLGCGGVVVLPKSFEGSSWQVVSIDGAQIAPERLAAIAFVDGRMSGSVGCNRISASYSYKDRKLDFGPVMSTKMACPDPVGKQEYAFVTLLEALDSTAFPGDGTMVLTGKNGTKAVLRQAV